MAWYITYVLGINTKENLFAESKVMKSLSSFLVAHFLETVKERRGGLVPSPKK